MKILFISPNSPFESIGGVERYLLNLIENIFFEKPILNSPYSYPSSHWELDKSGQPTQKILDSRRSVEYTATQR